MLHMQADPLVGEKVVLSECPEEVAGMGTGIEHVHVVLLSPLAVEGL